MTQLIAATVISRTPPCALQIGLAGRAKQHIAVNRTGPYRCELQAPPGQSRIEITILEGSASVGNFQTTDSWQVTGYFQTKYPEQTKKFITSAFDFAVINDEFFQDLLEHDFLEPDKAANFGYLEIHYVLLNDEPVPFLEHYDLSCGDRLAVVVRKPRIGLPRDVPVKSYTRNIQWARHYDSDIIDRIDRGFYKFVDQKLRHNAVPAHPGSFATDHMPYVLKARIQTQLVDNWEFIRDRHIVDLGCNRGQFMWPCLALGCASVTGIQHQTFYNEVINQALDHFGETARARAIYGNVYDLALLSKQLAGKDTVLVLGLAYHLNNHYDFFKTVSKSSASALIIDISLISDKVQHYCAMQPNIRYEFETHGVELNGWEIDPVDAENTFVGTPNASWLTQCLRHLGWHIKSSKINCWMRWPQLKYRGVITAYR